MNAIINRLLLSANRCMPEFHLKQPGFTYIACGPFTKNKERTQKLKKQEIQDILINMNQIKLVLNRIWLMENLKI